ncbi:MAG: CvpA family protein [Clostridia bacterium]|nr:CvpA family protein [Clostridia bacterium]
MVFDIVCVSFILIFSLVMMKRGGMRAILSLGSVVLSVIVASSLYPQVGDFIYTTPLPENLEKIVSENIVVEANPEDFEAIDALPDFIKKAIGEAGTGAVESITQSLAETVTRVIINIITFILLIAATKIIISLMTRVLETVVKLPVLSEINALTGFLCGLAVSLVIVWIAVALTGAIGASNQTVAAWVENSRVADVMSSITPF